jgi:hypothetical protein
MLRASKQPNGLQQIRGRANFVSVIFWNFKSLLTDVKAGAKIQKIAGMKIPN